MSYKSKPLMRLREPVFLGEALHGTRTADNKVVKVSRVIAVRKVMNRFELETLNSRYEAIFESKADELLFERQLKRRNLIK